MIKREDLKSLAGDELQTKLKVDVEAYEAEVAGINDMEELKKREQDLMPLMQEHDNYLSELKYALPEEVEYEGKRYTRRDVATSLIYFLNKAKVKWELTLGMHQLIAIWKNRDAADVLYRAYDATLRTLSTMEFQGDDEWRQILVVNEYMRNMHEEYTRDTSYTYYLAGYHNAILNRMQLLSPGAEPVEASNFKEYKEAE